jgi:hydrogenase maturation factor
MGRVVAIDATAGVAAVSLGAITAEVALDLLDHIEVGDAVMVHLGFAIARLEDV